MTDEENKRRSADEKVNYIKEHLCDKSMDNPFVFISYKSDDWETVLQDIVYRLVKEYGLNVYFDGSFDVHNPLWIEQFPMNMGSNNCKGFLAFLDNQYATSYATLMELMCSQSRLDEDYELSPLPVIPVYLDKLTGITDEEDTGLGKKKFADGTKNINAASEKKLFDQLVEELQHSQTLFGPLYRVYKQSKYLSRKLCSGLVDTLLAHVKANDNFYSGKGGDLSGIVGSIQDACGEEVFSKARMERSESMIVDAAAGPGDVSVQETFPAFRQEEELHDVISGPVPLGGSMAGTGSDSKPASPVLIPGQTTRWVYRTKKGACAHILWDGGSKNCKVLKGSVAARESEKFATSVPAAKKLKDQITSQGILNGLTFMDDYDCDKIATMINLLNGGSVSMPAEMKGRNLVQDEGEANPAQPAVPQVHTVSVAAPLAAGGIAAENAKAEEHVYTYKNARIRCDIRTNVCTVLQGSATQGESPKFATNAPGAKKLKDELRQKGIIIDDVFQEDYKGSMATLLNLINGGSVSATREKNKFGRID